MENFSEPDKNFLLNLANAPGLGARYWAQVLAWAPVMFHVTKTMRDLGLLKALLESPEGLTFAELGQKADLSEYSLSVLLDGAKSCAVLEVRDDRYFATAASEYLQNDRLTRVNMDFTHDVCYRGMAALEESLRKNVPAGLKEFGAWATIYEGLLQLPPEVQKSWLAFDHYYSDDAFPRVMRYVFANKPKNILDVGGNTGKFSRAAARFDSEVEITILDYPQQLTAAEEEARKAGLQDRIHFKPSRLLDHSNPFPTGFDVIWMSQFLDCFSKEDILALMKRARAAMSDHTRLIIMEPFIDNQRFETSEFCLNMGSLYFTALANGQSRFYRVTDFYELLAQAGLRVEEESQIRLSQTVLKCVKT